MKALTLTQPYATLVAIGAKRIETRSWSTHYRGPLAIHAAKGFPRDCRELCASQPFLRELTRAGVSMPELPRGAILAVARLAFVMSTDHHTLDPRWPLTDKERAFGDYDEGRYAWLLADVARLVEPIPCRGMLGLWTLDEELERRVFQAEKETV